MNAAIDVALVVMMRFVYLEILLAANACELSSGRHRSRCAQLLLWAWCQKLQRIVAHNLIYEKDESFESFELGVLSHSSVSSPASV